MHRLYFFVAIKKTMKYSVPVVWQIPHPVQFAPPSSSSSSPPPLLLLLPPPSSSSRLLLPHVVNKFPPTNCHQRIVTIGVLQGVGYTPRCCPGVVGSPPLCRCDLRGRRSTLVFSRGLDVRDVETVKLSRSPTNCHQPTATHHSLSSVL